MKVALKNILFAVDFFALSFFAFPAARMNLPPDWVENPSAKYPENRYLTMLGTGSSRDAAENDAKNRLFLFIRQNVDVQTKSASSFSMSGAAETSDYAYSSTSTAISSINDIVGLKVVENWAENRQPATHYALVAIDRMNATNYYTQKIASNDQVIAEYKNFAAQEKTIEGYIQLIKAQKIAAENSEYYDILRAVGLSKVNFNSDDERQIALEIKKYAAECAIAVSVSLDDGESDSAQNKNRVEGAILQSLRALGFSVQIGGKNANSPYFLDAKVSISPLPKKDSAFFSRYELAATLTEAKSDKVVFSFTKNGREGHISQEDLKQRIFRSIENDFAKDFFTKFEKTLK